MICLIEITYEWDCHELEDKEQSLNKDSKVCISNDGVAFLGWSGQRNPIGIFYGCLPTLTRGSHAYSVLREFQSSEEKYPMHQSDTSF